MTRITGSVGMFSETSYHERYIHQSSRVAREDFSYKKRACTPGRVKIPCRKPIVKGNDNAFVQARQVACGFAARTPPPHTLSPSLSAH
jgi:hypothetical protein